MAQLRILTYYHIPNNGAFVFVYSLLNLLKSEFGDDCVKILSHKTRRQAIYQYLKQFKLFPGEPLFYRKRARIFEKEINAYLDLDNDFPKLTGEKRLQHFLAENHDALLVGMDTWCLIKNTERPHFPNIFWLPEETQVTKLAYGISAYNSNPDLIQQSKKEFGRYLDGFAYIGVRDRFTLSLVEESRSRRDGLVELVPDPTFSYEFRDTDVLQKLQQFGVDIERPSLGLLLYGDQQLSNKIVNHYREKGYQILALSMYNPDADVNLGHVLTPFEWAEAFRYLSFCVSDRFHGTIFCMMNQTPFVCLEKERYLSRKQSKIYDLLTQFDLVNHYFNPSDDDFETGTFLVQANEIEASWGGDVKEKLINRITEFKKENILKIQRMKTFIGE
ncbi:MAG: polysaccharide pyruvyl transferase family protein [Anaerolineaceae bacterium]|nr:polysaccharide pyruvyl transferase family protein [Anaerolineaceae bacterium]